MNSDDNPEFLGPTLIHFQRHSSIFRRFLLEMCAHNPKIRDLRTLGTDQEIPIFDGFSSILPNLNFLLCVYHLEQGDKQKLCNLVHQKGAKQAIIADIYCYRYGGVQEYVLADSTDPDNFHEKLESLQEEWDRLCPGFQKWFCEKRKPIFVQSLAETARSGTAAEGLFYNNNIECQHLREKLEQSYKKGSLKTVISTLQKLVERQGHDEIKAIYGSDRYSLNKQYSKFKTESVKWHSMAGEYTRKHVKKFRMYKPTLDNEYVKPKESGKKPSDGYKRIRKQQETEVVVDRHSKRICIEDPNFKPEIPFGLFFRSLVPRLVEKCQDNCGRKLSP